MNVFLDTNVLMDVLLERHKFFSNSREVWFLAERAKIRGMISVLSFTNIYYIVRKLNGTADALDMMAKLRDTFRPTACDEQILNQAIDSDFEDFEDAVQFYSAVRAGAQCILSRNLSHFPRSDPPVLTPAEFLAAYSFE